MNRSILFTVITIGMVFLLSAFASSFPPNNTNSLITFVLEDATYWDHSGSQQVIRENLQSTAEQRAPELRSSAGIDSNQTLTITLIRKLFRNQNKHVNGIKFDFALDKKESKTPVTFNQINQVKIELQYQPELSYQPTPETLTALPQFAANQLHAQSRFFRLTLFGHDHDNVATLTPYADVNFEVQPHNGIQTITINLDDIQFYRSVNYRRQGIEGDFDSVIKGALITAETVGYTTLENILARRPLGQNNNKEKLLTDEQNSELYIESRVIIHQITLL